MQNSLFSFCLWLKQRSPSIWSDELAKCKSGSLGIQYLTHGTHGVSNAFFLFQIIIQRI